MSLVSVIIPNYNHAPFLKARIDSVLAQTFTDFEVLLLDDCSTDNSREILDAYRDHPRVSKVVYNEQNSGSTFRQWQKGVALATGQLVWIAESDDWAEPGFLAALVPVLMQRPDVGLAYSNSFYVDEDGRKTHTYSEGYANWSRRWQQDFFSDGTSEVVGYLRFATVILNASSCIFRKQLFLDAGALSTTFRLAGDWITYVQMLQRSSLYYCSQPLNHFRCHARSVRSRSKEFIHFYERLRVLAYIYQNFSVPRSERTAQLYSLLEDYSSLRPVLDSRQRRSVLSFLRRNLSSSIDLMRLKYVSGKLMRRYFNL